MPLTKVTTDLIGPTVTSFTPNIEGTSTAGSGVYTTQLGRYIKIGQLCYITIQITQTSHSGTGNIQISGLPFTSLNVTSLNQAFTVLWSDLNIDASATGYENVVAFVAPNSTILSFRQVGDNLTTAVIPIDTDALSLTISGSYITSS